MKTLLLTLILSMGIFAQVPQCTSTGQAYWTVTPYLSQIYGCAGGGKTEVSILLQGFTGVAELRAYDLRIHAVRITIDGDLYLDGNEIVVGPSDSAGPGYRTLAIANSRDR